jgi:phage terminase large subunit-like protein
MPTGLALLGKVRSLLRLQAWALEQQAEQEPPEPPPPPAAEARSTEERFWAFWHRVNPRLREPWHFRVYVRQVLRAVGGDLRLVFAAPPQHGKTEVTLALLAFLTLEHAGRRWAYVTYNQKRANSVARKMKRVFASAGVVPGGTLAQMYLPGGGQILFTSIDGGITGEPIDGACFIDDPYKGRKEADSAARREVVESTYREAIEVRVHPGASIFLLATRWHPEDLSGTLIAEEWAYINLQAVAEGAVNDNGVVLDDPNGRQVGEVLFPELWPLEALEKKRKKVLEFTWIALYQGRPRPKGGKVFHEPTYYSKLPSSFRGTFGLDLAYTARTEADWSICLELWREEVRGGEPIFYVVCVDRAQVEATMFALTLKARCVKRPAFRMHWRRSGTEKGGAQFLKKQRLPIDEHTPPGDKLVCATSVAAAWNDGRVQVPDPEFFPDSEEWLHAFLGVIANFTGTAKNERDDDVDALATAFDYLQTPKRVFTGRRDLPKPRE